MLDANDLAAIRALVEDNKLTEALEQLAAQPDAPPSVNALRTQWETLAAQNRTHQVTRSDFNRQRANIGRDILRISRGERPLSINPPAKRSKPLTELLKTVEREWVQNIYQKSVAQYGEIPVSLTAAFSQVNHPYQERQQSPELPATTNNNILATFDHLQGQFLILGKAGSGKTFLLSSLVASLVKRAKAESDLPIPIPFFLGNWQSSDQSLYDWLLAEFQERLGQRPATTSQWIKQQQLYILLEGLEQLQPSQQAACLQAINQFRGQYSPPGLVVATRPEAYEAQATQLALNGAVRLQPLTQLEVQDFLSRQGEAQFQDLARILQEDRTLLELAQTPFGLTTMITGYKNLPLSALTLRSAEDIQTRRHHLFNNYINQIFQKPDETPYQKEDTKRWLTWLAKSLHEQDKSIFMIDQIQPSWLPNRYWQNAYLLISRLLLGVVTGLLGGLIIGLGLQISWEGAIRGLSEGFVASVVGGLVVALINMFWHPAPSASAKNQHRPSLISILVIGSAVGFTAWLVISTLFGLTEFLDMDAAFWRLEGAMVGIAVGLSYALIFGFEPSNGPRSLTNDIQPVEMLGWSQTRAWTGILYGTVIGIVVGIVVASMDIAQVRSGGNFFYISPFFRLLDSWEVRNASQYILYTAALSAVVLGVIGLIVGGVTGSISEPSSKASLPGRGLRLSRKNGLLLGSAVSIILTLILVLAVNAQTGLYGIYMGFLAALWYGWMNIFLYWVLRLVLWHLDFVPKPLNYIPFLNFCSDRLLLHQVYGGYQFKHEYWRSFFAAQSLEVSDGRA